MRIVFMGSPEFATPALLSLADDAEIEVALVITQPDRPAGRGQRLLAPPVKLAALERGLPVLQPESMRDEDALGALNEAQPDLLVVIAYGELLRRSVLDAAPYGALNVHPSLLPRYRGAAPIPAAILNGDARTGISIIRLTRRMDAGPIVRQDELDITAADTTATLSTRLAWQAAALLPRTCHDYVSGALTVREQDEADASYTREWTKQDARVDWTSSAAQVARLVRAAQPWPIAWTTAADERLQILAATTLDDHSAIAAEPGDVRLVDGRCLAQTGAGVLELREVQPAGKRAMPAAAWWRGRHGATSRFV